MKSPLFHSIFGCSRVVAAALLLAGVACAQQYVQTNLVSNLSSMAPKTNSWWRHKPWWSLRPPVRSTKESRSPWRTGSGNCTLPISTAGTLTFSTRAFTR
jgi:hypothetical protein